MCYLRHAEHHAKNRTSLRTYHTCNDSENNFIIFQSICLSVSPIPHTTKRSMALFYSVTFSHSACLLPQSSDQPLAPFVTTHQCLSKTSDSPLYEFYLLQDLQWSDRLKDRLSGRQSVGVIESAVWGTLEFHLLPDLQQPDQPTDLPLPTNLEPSEIHQEHERDFGSVTNMCIK